MKTFIALFAVLALAVVSVSVKGQDTDEVWVSNQSGTTIRASTEYDFSGSSQFQNRQIPPGTAQSDVYTQANCNGAGTQDPLGVTLWIDGSSNQHQIWIQCDQSVVAENHPNGPGLVDIYISVYNSINSPTGSVLVTLQP